MSGSRTKVSISARPGSPALRGELQHAVEHRGMQLHDLLKQLDARWRAQPYRAASFDLADQRVDALRLFSSRPAKRLLVFSQFGHGSAYFSCPIRPNMGEWRVSSTLPLPRYMWTPHGRHGSKLRTARMMSMPLNLSGPFSSKIGVFCTASS